MAGEQSILYVADGKLIYVHPLLFEVDLQEISGIERVKWRGRAGTKILIKTRKLPILLDWLFREKPAQLVSDLRAAIAP